MTTLVVQIPCLNEEASIGVVVGEVPRKIPGIDRVLVLVIDDGSSDETGRAARDAGADEVLRHPSNLGLAAAFSSGISRALEMGADVIVNTDADNQYPGSFIPELVAPIVNGAADVAIGARPIRDIPEFGTVKRFLQRLGSGTTRTITRLDVADAPSGFRAFSRRTAQLLFVYTRYTYTLETLVQMGIHRLRVASVPISTNAPVRPSRLVRNNFTYVLRSIATLIRVLLIYRALPILGVVGGILVSASAILGIRYLILLAHDPETGSVQSLVLASILAISGLMFILAGFIGDLISANRQLMEDLRSQIRALVSTDSSESAPSRWPLAKEGRE